MKKTKFPEKVEQRFTKAHDCVVLKGFKNVFEGTNTACYKWVLKNQPQSVWYATTKGNYSVISKDDYEAAKANISPPLS